MNLRRFLRFSGFLSLGSALLLLLTFSTSPAQENPPIPDELKEKVMALSGLPMMIAAQELGITEIMGKDITAPSCPPGKAKAKILKDVGIGVHPVNHENEPTIVANPIDKKKLVAGSHFYDVSVNIYYCVAYYSSNNGATWSDPIFMPGLTPASRFSDPVLAYAPDGSRVYYAYMDLKSGLIENPPLRTIWSDYDIVVSYSDDDGQTWTGPIIALDGDQSSLTYNTETEEIIAEDPGFDYDKCWIGTHVPVAGPQNNSNWVYVTATQFDSYSPPPDRHIAFTRSGDKGMSWSAPILFDDVTSPLVVQGSRPHGGLGSDVLVAYYHSGLDGWLEGGFEIKVAYSANNGATFNAPMTAAFDSFECSFWLGPYYYYHRWWGTMFPDIEIDPGGEAHIVYTHDPVEGYETSEEGDIRYVGSLGPPYDLWSMPVTVNDDGLERAQGYPALEVQYGGNLSILHVIWEDHRLSPDMETEWPESPNLFFDYFYSRKIPTIGTGWFSNFLISEASSISDWAFIGDYNDLAANQTTLFGIWIDRRHQTDILAGEDNVYGSRIIAGGGRGR